MGDFGYKKRDSILGEIGSTANNTIRTGVAVGDIEYGDFIELAYRGLANYDQAGGIGVRTYIDLLDEGIPTFGVAVYKPSSSDGRSTQYKYLDGSQVRIMTEGDVRLAVPQGELCLYGDPAYLAFINNKYAVTSVKLGSKFEIGYFAETVLAGEDDTCLVSLDIKKDVLEFPPLNTNN